MALSDDQRNAARGHVEEVSGELGDYSQIVLSVTIEGTQWETIKGRCRGCGFCGMAGR